MWELAWWHCRCGSRIDEQHPTCPKCGAPQQGEITRMTWPPPGPKRLNREEAIAIGRTNYDQAVSCPMSIRGVLDPAFVNNVLNESVNPF